MQSGTGWHRPGSRAASSAIALGVAGRCSARFASGVFAAPGQPAGRTNSTGKRASRRQLAAAERVAGASYRDPLLDAALTLQARLYNIVEQRLPRPVPALRRPGRGAVRARLHAVRHRRVPVLGRDRPARAALPRRGRRSAQPAAAAARWTQIQIDPPDRPGSESPFRVFRGPQRAIAELMMVPTGADRRARAPSASGTPRSAAGCTATSRVRRLVRRARPRHRRRSRHRPATGELSASCDLQRRPARHDRLPRPADGVRITAQPALRGTPTTSPSPVRRPPSPIRKRLDRRPRSTSGQRGAHTVAIPLPIYGRSAAQAPSGR